MTVGTFDSKHFNAEVFGGYVDTIPQLNKNELLKSRVLVPSAEIKALLGSQTGSFFATKPIYGRIDGEALNFDGTTDITATQMETYTQSFIAFGRMKAWLENDFSYEITAGVDFMDEVGKQVSQYWEDVDFQTMLHILRGIFSMTGAKELEFVNAHTHDVSGEGEGKVQATTLNTAIQKALGDRKSKFTMAFMHSVVATNLENQNLLQFLKYTDKQGVERPLPLAHWNGKMVYVDDNMPFEEVPAVEADSSQGIEAQEAYTKYTTYVFGEGAFEYANLGVKHPYEMSRDPAKNGGQDTLYSRKRTCIAPKGISFTQASLATLSPTDAELATGSNWKLVDNRKTGSARKVFPHRDIAIARIFSRG